MTGSFWVYAQQTEDLAYEQLDHDRPAAGARRSSHEHHLTTSVEAEDEFQS